MLDKAEIRKEIARLEYEESSYPNYAKLADLYVIRDKMEEQERGRQYVNEYSAAPPPVTVQSQTVGEYGDSDFLLTVAGKDPERAWKIIDELMDSLAIVNIRVYDSIMRKLKSA